VATPFLSVVVPALNEESCIGAFVDQMRGELSMRVPSWEIVVVDDGSTDRTRAIVEGEARADGRIRLITGPHRGKGAALQQGMAAATGEWRFMADADLAMPVDNLTRFLALVDAEHPPDIIIGSREAPGSQRVGESWWRHVVGRAFNWIVRTVAVRGIADTQCGFKLLKAAAADVVFPRMTITGFAFDVEMLFLARRAGLDVREVGIVWHGRGDSRVGLGRGAAAFADILRIRWRWRNVYATWAYALTAVLAAGVAYDLLRMPVQVFDSLGEILAAERSHSVWYSFESALGATGYLRPLRIAQIKALFDLSDGHYWLVYRGFHAVLLALCLWLFTRALLVKTAADLAAAAFALTVLTGMSTFRGTVQEAFPINHFLEMVVCGLAVLNLAQSRAGWRVDVAAAVIFAAAALTLESGLLVWVVALAAWMAGMRGVSRRSLVVLTALLAAYVYLRFVYLTSGTPGLSERSSGYLLSVLEPAELQQRFGDRPYGFYAYNVIASMLAVLFSEPQSGVFVALRGWLQGDLPPRVIVATVASGTTTLLIIWAAWRLRRAGERLDHSAQLIFVAAAVLVANAVLSYAYTKDEIMSIAGAFYALAAFAAVRFAIGGVAPARAAVAACLAIVLLVSGSAWAVRSVGLHHILRLQAFRHRGDWAELPALRAAEGARAEEVGQAWLVDALRNSALAMPAPNPRFYSRWAEQVWGD
jgi:dolichyl-phosphate beta-glucosyltransferase